MTRSRVKIAWLILHVKQMCSVVSRHVFWGCSLWMALFAWSLRPVMSLWLCTNPKTVDYQSGVRCGFWLWHWACVSFWMCRCRTGCPETCWPFQLRAGCRCEWELLTPPCMRHRWSRPVGPKSSKGGQEQGTTLKHTQPNEIMHICIYIYYRFLLC